MSAPHACARAPRTRARAECRAPLERAAAPTPQPASTAGVRRLPWRVGPAEERAQRRRGDRSLCARPGSQTHTHKKRVFRICHKQSTTTMLVFFFLCVALCTINVSFCCCLSRVWLTARYYMALGARQQRHGLPPLRHVSVSALAMAQAHVCWPGMRACIPGRYTYAWQS